MLCEAVLTEQRSPVFKSDKTRKIRSIVAVEDKRAMCTIMWCLKKTCCEHNIAGYYTEAIAQRLRSWHWRNPFSTGGCGAVGNIYKKLARSGFSTPEDVYFDIVEICRFSPCDVLIKGDIRLPGDILPSVC
jgi:hypothetical protein